MSAQFDVLIAGAGHGGAQAAISLRQAGFSGSIGLVGEEPWAPYDRPALSKEYLAGERPFEKMLLRPLKFWDERGVSRVASSRITAVDADAHAVALADGAVLSYGRMIWATGGEPRRLECDGHALGGVHTVRKRSDVDQMIGELAQASRIVVVGGGYIGLEAAAALSKLGKAVTIVEAADRVLARVAAPALSRFYEDEHRAHGVTFRLSAAVACLEGGDGRVTGVRLTSDEVLPADLVIVGIGIVPAVAPLLAAGARGGNGVEIDGRCRTSLPDVFAVGDCALHANRFAGGAMVRLESIQNANDQAMVAAKVICGQDIAYDAVPWFWSNQYDLRLQTVGLARDYDAVELQGDVSSRSFSLRYLRQGRVIALDCVNAAKAYVQGRSEVLQSFSA